ncbi:MAG TPA: carboxylating nicotinate-nucleotide diphosphorylase [Dictyoglomaceae bacterium]|nr:carboxylating nicotinate-nucleotide diphosphorylase [Dictyoglomaceae bacterium]HOL38985.1 carboxylating nicotinate-nucleotide diphosphorylase [Dictyoglomaceae bacterium]HOP94324.1 carboxylating nicotinate-nucleotide diphosphorylase [Dictyoglomaceae bacterium]HPP15839.1 carboxylating nicotinate-nucleotide diphosphorylase [Dictyoglomaceae bacterium]HPU42828.1 carboxylating nicotinate-nucleotide diphosphorylase [Dictyoglomaceae bacterium]
MRSIPYHLLRKIVEEALNEDIGTGDITTDSIVPENMSSKAMILAKEEGVIAGLLIAREVFRYLDPEISFNENFKDGEKVKNGDVIAEIYGNTRAILSGERTALNFLQRLSGIATYTKKCAEIVEPYGVKILDTRKTTPLLRILEKYAVKVGGGENHRFSLYDMVLIKDNHIKVAGDIKGAVKKVRENISHVYKIEVEVTNLEELKEALECDVDMVLLDNMDINKIKECVEITKGKVLTEVSGNVSMENLEDIAKLGINFISMGKLTHSVKSLDISLEIE